MFEHKAFSTCLKIQPPLHVWKYSLLYLFDNTGSIFVAWAGQISVTGWGCQALWGRLPLLQSRYLTKMTVSRDLNKTFVFPNPIRLLINSLFLCGQFSVGNVCCLFSSGLGIRSFVFRSNRSFFWSKDWKIDSILKNIELMLSIFFKDRRDRFDQGRYFLKIEKIERSNSQPRFL